MISARVICDSVSPDGKRLTTFQLRYPKFIHGEFMTHRVISRNASSSRAIPVKKLIAEVRDDATRAGPVWWGAEQKGMTSGDELDDTWPIGQPYVGTTQRGAAKSEWATAAISATLAATRMAELGVHKSIVNRLLEPFSHINVVASATEWGNFFGLRLDRAAQPEMRTLAEQMWAALNESKPELLKPGKWHLPFVAMADDGEMFRASVDVVAVMETINRNSEDGGQQEYLDKLIKISVARCARVSYMSNDTGKRSTVDEDLMLYERLVGAQPLHASPAEHQATPDVRHPSDALTRQTNWNHPTEHGNFIGWRQYRKMLPGEACAPLPKEYSK